MKFKVLGSVLNDVSNWCLKNLSGGGLSPVFLEFNKNGVGVAHYNSGVALLSTPFSVSEIELSEGDDNLFYVKTRKVYSISLDAGLFKEMSGVFKNNSQKLFEIESTVLEDEGDTDSSKNGVLYSFRIGRTVLHVSGVPGKPTVVEKMKSLGTVRQGDFFEAFDKLSKIANPVPGRAGLASVEVKLSKDSDNPLLKMYATDTYVFSSYRVPFSLTENTSNEKEVQALLDGIKLPKDTALKPSGGSDDDELEIIGFKEKDSILRLGVKTFDGKTALFLPYDGGTVDGNTPMLEPLLGNLSAKFDNDNLVSATVKKSALKEAVEISARFLSSTGADALRLVFKKDSIEIQVKDNVVEVPGIIETQGANEGSEYLDEAKFLKAILNGATGVFNEGLLRIVLGGIGNSNNRGRILGVVENKDGVSYRELVKNFEKISFSVSKD